MKKTLLAISGLVLAASVAQATLTYSSPTVVNTAIPDANPGGLSSSIMVSGAGIDIVRDVNVTLEISGGYNGDLYGYLVGPDGGMAVLLNRIGRTGTDSFGYSGGGMNLTFNDGAGTDIHTTAGNGVLGSTWASDGRLVNPLNAVDTDARNARLDQVFAEANNHAVNGTWTLFLADMSGGDVGTLVSWGLDITVVPEPVTWAMMIFAALLGALRFRSKLAAVCRRLNRWVDAV